MYSEEGQAWQQCLHSGEMYNEMWQQNWQKTSIGIAIESFGRRSACLNADAHLHRCGTEQLLWHSSWRLRLRR